MTPLIALDDVTLGYDHAPVLERVTLTVEPGEVLALLGPNGAGKTTLFRGMLGLIPPRAGRITYGFDRAAHPPGYVPQKEALDPIFPLTAFEVVRMGASGRLRPLVPAGRREHEAARARLAQVGMAALADHPFWALSGGQKQRVLIARALAVEPTVMLLDEPTAGIDSAAEATIMEIITALNRDRGLTVVLVSHHLRLVRSLVRTAIWVEDRRAVKGPTEEVLGEGVLGGGDR
jgi:ABC-type Mn2+/Zn2+ transport system ATPase subunit